MTKKQELLNKHPYKVWEGSNGKWYTYLPDEEKGRILKKKSTKEAIENDIYLYWKDVLESPTKDHLDIRNAAILLMFVTGMRIGEVVVLKSEDLNPIKNTILIRRIETRYKENGKTYYDINPLPKTINGYREIIIPTYYRWLIRDLKTVADGHDFIFHENEKRITTLLIRKRLYKVCNELKIDKKSPHKIRKTYDSILQDANLDSRFIINQMGHSDIKTSETYYHRDRKNYKNKVAIIDSIEDFVV